MKACLQDEQVVRPLIAIRSNLKYGSKEHGHAA